MGNGNMDVYPTNYADSDVTALIDVVAYLLEERRKRLQAADSGVKNIHCDEKQVTNCTTNHTISR